MIASNHPFFSAFKKEHLELLEKAVDETKHRIAVVYGLCEEDISNLMASGPMTEDSYTGNGAEITFKVKNHNNIEDQKTTAKLVFETMNKITADGVFCMYSPVDPEFIGFLPNKIIIFDLAQFSKIVNEKFDKITEHDSHKLSITSKK